eukprot:SAG31_NODE_3236_length_4509_cov_2.012472_3_plen_80_part_00
MTGHSTYEHPHATEPADESGGAMASLTLPEDTDSDANAQERTAAILIQAAWRGCMERKMVDSVFKQVHSCHMYLLSCLQ